MSELATLLAGLEPYLVEMEITRPLVEEPSPDGIHAAFRPGLETRVRIVVVAGGRRWTIRAVNPEIESVPA